MKTLLPKNEITATYAKVKEIIEAEGFTVYEENLDKPWGGYIRLIDANAEAFVRRFFPNLELEVYENLSPKFLLVGPGQRLSWQEHERRAERWRVLEGPVGVKINENNEEPADITVLETGEMIEFDTKVCHRLIGLSDWGVVVETWIHTDDNNPSDEDDITRWQDDYKR